MLETSFDSFPSSNRLDFALLDPVNVYFDRNGFSSFSKSFMLLLLNLFSFGLELGFFSETNAFISVKTLFMMKIKMQIELKLFLI